MINTDYQETLDTYESAIELSNEIINEVSSFYHVTAEQLRWHDFMSYAQEKYDVVFRTYKFNSAASRILSGSLLITDYGAAVGFNREMPETRQHFTITHELAHFFKTVKTKIMRNQSYSDLVENRGYTDSEEPEELEANFVSSLLLIPIPALENMIKNGHSFGHIQSQFGISSQALFRRLINHFVLKMGLSVDFSKQIVRDFENGNNRGIRKFFSKQISSDDKFNLFTFIY